MTRGIRGAITADENSREAIFSATAELLNRIIRENNLETDNITSIVLTMTTDLNADFPAVAAREVCGKWVPLLCAQELEISGAMPGVIRVLLHVETGLKQKEIKHVYLKGAEKLRPDLFGEEKGK
ncbi:MAG: chorismate mutase [Planctomycetota bacterium]|nr:MAG: chorismate mutase [Planctomycetota bacterium]